MDLRGNVVLMAGVSGAAHPAGAALSLRLAAAGASVALLDRRPEALASRIDGAGGHVLALPGDQRDRQSVRAAVGRLLTAWERIDIVLTGIDGLEPVAEAVSRYLPDAARTGSRGVADLIVLATPGTEAAAHAEASCERLRQDLAGQPVRIELVAGAEVTDRVLRLIGQPAPIAGRAG